MSKATKEQIEQLKAEGRALLAKATPGEWRRVNAGTAVPYRGTRPDGSTYSGETSTEDDHHILTDADLDDIEVLGTSEWLRIRKEDAELIVWLKNNAAALLAEAQEKKEQ